MKETMDLNNQHEFDCRRYIKPGDVIKFDSMWGCELLTSSKHGMTVSSGRAVKMCERFVFVKLRNVTECVNRWAIRSINGKKINNGCFRYFEAIR